MAPLMAAEKGTPAYESCKNGLKAIIRPPTAEQKRKSGIFAKLWALATQPK